MAERITDALGIDMGLSARVLDFFNSVSDSAGIINTIRDDPEFGSGTGRGIRPALAARILAVRNTLPGQQFTSIEQINDVRGVGRDTMVDILYTFGYEVHKGVEFFVLDFFNSVQSAGDIISRIKDDPDFQNRDGYGIQPWSSLASRIISTREGLPAGRFESLHQLEEIEGIGRDTMHDILYTFAHLGAAGAPEFGLAWGNGDRQFQFPFDIGVDGNDNLYVVDTNNHRVQKLDQAGTFMSEWGEKGTGPAEFLYPRGIAVDVTGNVYVADTTTHRVQKFDSSGAFLLEWGQRGPADGDFDTPEGIAVDGAGNVYVADSANHRIQKFDSGGSYIGRWGSQGTSDGEFDFPAAIAIDAAGDVYVADSQNHRIQKFDSTGNFLTKWGSRGAGAGQFYNLRGLALDAAGDIYVADTTGNHRVQRFDSDGVFVMEWGGVGTEEGQFNTPEGIAIDSSGKVYLADTQNHRIQVFDAGGQFLAAWES